MEESRCGYEVDQTQSFIQPFRALAARPRRAPADSLDPLMPKNIIANFKNTEFFVG